MGESWVSLYQSDSLYLLSLITHTSKRNLDFRSIHGLFPQLSPSSFESIGNFGLAQPSTNLSTSESFSSTISYRVCKESSSSNARYLVPIVVLLDDRAGRSESSRKTLSSVWLIYFSFQIANLSRWIVPGSLESYTTWITVSFRSQREHPSPSSSHHLLTQSRLDLDYQSQVHEDSFQLGGLVSEASNNKTCLHRSCKHIPASAVSTREVAWAVHITATSLTISRSLQHNLLGLGVSVLPRTMIWHVFST